VDPGHEERPGYILSLNVRETKIAPSAARLAVRLSACKGVLGGRWIVVDEAPGAMGPPFGSRIKACGQAEDETHATVGRVGPNFGHGHVVLAAALHRTGRSAVGGYRPLALGVSTVRYPIPQRTFKYVATVQSVTDEPCL
jgi:hypothetical protein